MFELSHIGELIISEMLSQSSACYELVCCTPHPTSRTLDFIPSLKLEQCAGLIFDGGHRIDVAIINSDSKTCHPIEAKLGFSNMSRNAFQRRFLSFCGTSHENRRIKGSMISILENNLPIQCKGSPVTVLYNKKQYQISKEWTLVCRKKIIEKWSTSGKPELTNYCQIIAFEDLVWCFGGKERFNELVKKLVTFDYYSTWCRQ